MTDSRDTPVHVDDRAELDELVADEDRLLVDFYTKGCTLCQAIEPVLGNVARATDATVALFNPRNDLDAVEEFDVRSVPTLVLFEDGDRLRSMADGFQGAQSIVDFVDGESATDDGDAETATA
ncbi:MAG: thioredoxin family protein [Halolamina sp.]